MGFNVGIESDVLFIEGRYPDFVDQQEKHIDRKYYQFVDQYVWELENSVLGQLNQLMGFEIDFLGKLYPWTGEEEIPDEYWHPIDQSIRNVKSLISELTQSSNWIHKIISPTEKLEINTKYYKNYILEGKLSKDLKVVLYNLENHKNAGASQIFFTIL